MRHAFFALALAVASPALAQSDEAEPPAFEGLEELADGLKQLFEGLADDLGPMIENLGEQLDGLNAYHPPEVLPNGDIIIRRKDPSELDKVIPNEDGSVDI